jgi:hypothetical protein
MPAARPPLLGTFDVLDTESSEWTELQWELIQEWRECFLNLVLYRLELNSQSACPPNAHLPACMLLKDLRTLTEGPLNVEETVNGLAEQYSLKPRYKCHLD